MNHLFVKGILLGNTAVGKTSFLSCGHGQNTGHLESSVNINYSTFFIRNEISFRIYDTAGQEQYRSMLDSYFRGSHIVFFMTTCDEKTKKTDDEQLLKLMNDAKAKLPSFIPIFILNKIDLLNVDLEQSLDENAQLKQREEEVKKPFIETLYFFETSCDPEYNVRNVIDQAYNLAVNKYGEKIKKEDQNVVHLDDPADPHQKEVQKNEKCSC